MAVALLQAETLKAVTLIMRMPLRDMWFMWLNQVVLPALDRSLLHDT